MFTIHKHDTAARLPWEFLAAAAGTYKVGQALSVADGVLTPVAAASATTPPYICMADVTVTAGDQIPVIRTADNAIYETALTAEAADAKVGTKLRVSAGGLGVDAGAAGTFEVTAIDNTAAGSAVYGRFA